MAARARLAGAVLLAAQGLLTTAGVLFLGGWAAFHLLGLAAGSVQPGLGSDTPKAALFLLAAAVPGLVFATAAFVSALTIAVHRRMAGRERLGGAALAVVFLVDVLLAVAVAF